MITEILLFVGGFTAGALAVIFWMIYSFNK